MITSKKLLSSLVALGCVAYLPISFGATTAVTTTNKPLSITPAPQLTAVVGKGRNAKKVYGGSWKLRFEEKCRVAQQGGFDVMFVGDSITHGMDLKRDAGIFNKMLAPAKIGNFGFGGDTTENVLWRFDHGNLDGKINPKVIMVMIGTNNTGRRMDKPEDIALGVSTIIDRLNTRFPKAEIILLGIFPRGAVLADRMRVNNEKANAIICKLDGSKGGKVHYMDISKKFLAPNGVLSRGIMPDLLHPNAKGYQIWADAVVPEIKKLLKQ